MRGAPEGLLLIDKPTGITSHDVVDAVRWAVGIRKVGHAGTLDPMATGLLLVGVARTTRLLRFLADLPKTYEGTARLGIQTDTLDADGEIVGWADVLVAGGDVEEAFARLVGESMQTPPAYSAVKVNGRPLHRGAREGTPVQASPRPIRVDEFALTAFDLPDVEFRVTCSSGTYVRVLLADAGAALGCGAHLTALRRTRIGPFDVSEATSPEAPGEPLPIHRAVAHLPRQQLDAEEAVAASHGGILGPAGFEGPYGVFGPEGTLLGVYRDEGAKGRPEVVLAPPPALGAADLEGSS
jgi:tRNA pseudouridine55 synthase